MKPTLIALLGALLAAGAMPVLAAVPSLDVPVSSAAPSMDPAADEANFDPAAVAYLAWDNTTGKAATQSTVARITTDGKALYVRFDAVQNQRIVSDQPINGRSDGDSVSIDLWPSGANGTLYRFVASPDGASSAIAGNGVAIPAWQASGTTYPGGYTVTMKIPLSAFHGAQPGGAWNVQFARTIQANGRHLVWSHDGAAGSPEDVGQAGTMTLPPTIASTGSMPGSQK